MKLDAMACPKCGAPLSFTEDQDFCYCSHCGMQVFKEDENLGVKMEYKKHVNDNFVKVEIAKEKEKGKADLRYKIFDFVEGLIALIAGLIFFGMVMYLVMHW